MLKSHMDRVNKIPPRHTLFNVSARYCLTPIYCRILPITKMLLLLYKNWWFIPDCLFNFLTPLTIESLFNYWRWYPYSFGTTIEKYVVSQHISHFSNYRLLSRDSTFDTTSHFSTRLSAFTQKYYPTHPSIAMFVNQCGNNSTTKLAARNETRTNLISSTKEGNWIYIQKIFLNQSTNEHLWRDCG